MFWQDFSWLNFVPLLQVQSKGVHSLPATQASPGCLGPGGPASGVTPPLPAQPPCAVHAAGQTALVGAHDVPWHGPPVTGNCPSLHPHTTGVQSEALLHVQPPWLAHEAGHAFIAALEQ